MVDPALGPDDLVVLRAQAATAVQDLDNGRLRTALVLDSFGYPRHEIADLLDVTPKAVEMLFYRARRRD